VIRPVLFLLVLLASAARADAHPAPFSYLDLDVSERSIEGSLVLHVFDAAHDLGIAAPQSLLDAPAAQAVRERLIELLAPRLSFSADGRAQAPEWGDVEPLPDRQALRVRFRIPVASPARLAVGARLFPYDPAHQSFLNLYAHGELRQQAILDGSGREHVYYADSVPGRLAVLKTFLPAGLYHIAIGADHILFLVALLLLGGSARGLVRIVTAFTLGHSATLSLAVLGIVTPPAHLVEPAIALSIVFVGVDNLLVGPGGRDVRAWAALGFGLIHGFGFASVLREQALPPDALGWSLLAFNLGVEAGQLGIVAVVGVALEGMRRHSQVMVHRFAVAASMAVVAAGAYWFIERVFFTGVIS
jgi:hydrogenase/urease accessory protein HupE